MSSKKKLLILGATGMAGHVAYTYLSETGKYDIATVCHSGKIEPNSYELDVYDTERLSQIIEKEKPNTIINCIGILIKGSKSNPSNAIYINAYFPHKLSEITHELLPGAKVIHISTDCVFSGNEGGYKDSDTKNALDTYGMTKNLGELINDKDITLRTSIIGPELKKNGEGLLHWYLMNRNTKTIDGYEKSIWSGITTLQLAKVIETCLDNVQKVFGLIQVSNNQAVSKYELLKTFQKYFGGNVVINKVEGIISNKSIQASKNSIIMTGGGIFQKVIQKWWGNCMTLCKNTKNCIPSIYRNYNLADASKMEVAA